MHFGSKTINNVFFIKCTTKQVGGVIVSCILIRSSKEQLDKVRDNSYVEYSYMDDQNQTYRL